MLKNISLILLTLLSLIVVSTHAQTILKKPDTLRNIKPDMDHLNSVAGTYRRQIDSLHAILSLKLIEAKGKMSKSNLASEKVDSLKEQYETEIRRHLQSIQDEGITLTSDESNFLNKSVVKDLRSPLELTSHDSQIILDDNWPVNKLKEKNVTFDLRERVGNFKTPEYLENGKDFTPRLETLPYKKQATNAVSQAREIKDDGLRSDKIDQIVEERISKVTELKTAQTALNGANQLKFVQAQEFEKIRNAQIVRDQLSSKIATSTIMKNETLVKEKILQLSKRKKRFDDLPDMRYVPKIKPNCMNGARLIDRLVPGSLWQISHSKNVVNWYVSPEILYRCSGTFSVGVGGNYLLQYNTQPKMLWNNPLFGYKFIGQAKTFKTFYLRSEWENNSVKSGKPDIRARTWQPNLLVGVGREKKVSNRFVGYFWSFYKVDNDSEHFIKRRIILKAGIRFNLTNPYKRFQNHVQEKLRVDRSKTTLQSTH